MPGITQLLFGYLAAAYLTQSLDFVCRLFAAVQPQFARPIRQKKSSKLVFREKFPGRSFEFTRTEFLA